jgi:O-antigen ligase
MNALMKHGDMPHSLFDISGLNLWNILWGAVVLGWVHRLRSEPRPRMPRAFLVAFFSYLLVILFTGLRGTLDVDSIRAGGEQAVAGYTISSFLNDYVANPIKFLVIPMLLASGFFRRRNVLLGIAALCMQGIVYSLMIIKFIPFEVLSSPLSRYRFRIGQECGLQANDMALVLVISFWMLACCLRLTRGHHTIWKCLLVGCMLVIGLAFTYCQSRGGYLAMLVIGLILALIRWRILLVVFPAVALIMCLVFPTIPARLTQGVSEADVSGEQVNDLDTMSAGRLTNLWPPTIDYIAQSPLIGYGRLAIWRTGLYDQILVHEGSVPNHPHNAYLEMLLDSGIIGLGLVFVFLIGIPIMVLRGMHTNYLPLLVARDCGLISAIALLVMGCTGQSFFPREGVFLSLCGYGLMMGASMASHHTSAPLKVYHSASRLVFQSTRAPR